MGLLKIHYPKSHFSPENRRQVFPFLLPFYREEAFSDSERQKVYGVSKDWFEYSENLKQADLVILTMSWNFYENYNRINDALKLIKLSQVHKKKVWVYMSGDFGHRMPNFKNILVFRHGGHKSKLPINHVAIPVFIRDPVKYHFDGRTYPKNEFTLRPIVGFCGQADGTFKTLIKESLKIVLRNLPYYLNLSTKTPQPIKSTSNLRHQAMVKFEHSDNIKTNFIRRKSYRAGAKSAKERHETKLEYFENMASSNYVLCVRGAGNFSVRFFETLAMGRIPILLDTDCLLPLSKQINWKEHIVIIKLKDLNSVAQRVVQWHSRLTPKQFEDISKSNRELWEKKLKFDTFFKTVLKSAV